VITRRQLKRRYVAPFFQRQPASVVGIEACASSNTGRATSGRSDTRFAQCRRPMSSRTSSFQKNDAADAEAICEAVTGPNMRFVETKTTEQQSCLMLHRTRHLFIRQQTAAINAVREARVMDGVYDPGRMIGCGRV